MKLISCNGSKIWRKNEKRISMKNDDYSITIILNKKEMKSLVILAFLAILKTAIG